jgi:hypothetical protein
VSKIQVEIDIGDVLDITRSDEMGWRNAMYLYAEGNTTQEVLDDATVFFCDKDGGEAGERKLNELPPEEAKNIPQVPGSLDEALNALEDDHAYLLEGGVFTEELVHTWIEYKRENELMPLAQRPHPYEFELYYGV